MTGRVRPSCILTTLPLNRTQISAASKDHPMRPQTLLIVTLTGLTATAARADDLCVVCTEPAATYRCEAGSSGISGAAAQVACIKDIAKRGGHQSCSVERARANAPCSGSLVTLDQPGTPAGAGGGPPAGAVPSASGSAEATAAATPVPAKPKDGPPATMEALAKVTVEQTKETTEAAGQNIKKAGSAVGSAFKKSWDCVVSLFSAC